MSRKVSFDVLNLVSKKCSSQLEALRRFCKGLALIIVIVVFITALSLRVGESKTESLLKKKELYKELLESAVVDKVGPVTGSATTRTTPESVVEMRQVLADHSSKPPIEILNRREISSQKLAKLCRSFEQFGEGFDFQTTYTPEIAPVTDFYMSTTPPWSRQMFTPWPKNRFKGSFRIKEGLRKPKKKVWNKNFGGFEVKV